MRTRRLHDFGDVKAIELGFGPVGRPLMTVFAYAAGGVLIDSSQPHQQRAYLAWAMTQKPEALLLTHHHEDHAGNAGALQKRTGLPVWAGADTVARLQTRLRLRPYQHWVWGAFAPFSAKPLSQPFSLNGLTFEPIATPGHSPDHTAYLVRERGWLFSGDLYLGDHQRFMRVDENLGDMIASLRRVLRYDFESLFCAHRPQLHEGPAHLRAKLQFLEDWVGRIRPLVENGMDSPAAIMRQLGIREDWRTSLFCTFHFNAANFVRAAVQVCRETRANIGDVTIG